MNGTVWIIVGAAFAATGIWLTVRIVNQGELWAKRTMVTIVTRRTPEILPRIR